jgi:hypothetical protein
MDNNEYPTCQIWPGESSGVHACFESREFTLLLQDMECHACAIAGQGRAGQDAILVGRFLVSLACWAK